MIQRRKTRLPPEVRARICSAKVTRTDAGLQARFGISYNTWRQIMADAPIRESLAVRLISRIASEDQGQAD